ncbi:MAG: hypothetical protein IT488_13965 [Gammaproteobacteria bacterium]|nr:hypothetical protein [Gammaproteobacteria bacterium]
MLLPASSAVFGATPYKVLLLLSGDGKPYQLAAGGFSRTLLRSAGRAIPFDLTQLTLPPQESDEPGSDVISRDDYDLIVPIGTRAAETIKSAPGKGAILNILTTRDAFEAIWRSDPYQDAGPVSAIYLEQPIARQIRFIQLALPRHRRCGVMLGKRSLHLVEALGAAAVNSRLNLSTIDLSSVSKPIDGIKSVLGSNDVILAIPDADALTPNIAKWLLYMAYQKEIPVIGFSRAFVDAGALGAIYTDPEQIGRQAAEIALRAALAPGNDDAGTWHLPPPQYPEYFNVAINDSVARSLKIRVRPGQYLTQSLIQLEQAETWRAQK